MGLASELVPVVGGLEGKPFREPLFFGGSPETKENKQVGLQSFSSCQTWSKVLLTRNDGTLSPGFSASFGVDTSQGEMLLGASRVIAILLLSHGQHLLVDG